MHNYKYFHNKLFKNPYCTPSLLYFHECILTALITIQSLSSDIRDTKNFLKISRSIPLPFTQIASQRLLMPPYTQNLTDPFGPREEFVTSHSFIPVFLLLAHNNFSFHFRYLLQVRDTPKRTNRAPTYENIFKGSPRQDFLK